MNSDPINSQPARTANGKAGICVSIIFPTHKKSPERRVDLPELKKAIDKAKKYLQQTYSKRETTPLVQALDNLFAQIDFTRNSEGVGLFVSADVQELVPFFFPVKEKIFIGPSFDIRHRIDHDYYAQPYLVLQLSEKEAKLYRGSLDNLSELKDENFPLHHSDDYEYSPPARGNSNVGQATVQGFEKDKTRMETIRHERFLRRVEAALKPLLANNPLLLVSGSERSVSLFKKVSQAVISGEIQGNYWHSQLTGFETLCQQTLQAILNNRKRERIAAFRESIGKGHGMTALTSIYEIWKSIMEGRGLQLLAERDFSIPGYFGRGDDNNLYLHPLTVEYDTVPDVINRMMEIILEKRGSVLVVDNEALADYGRIGLLTRY